jgi:hypothetical protein
MSSMPSAPASIPATSDITFATTAAPHATAHGGPVCVDRHRANTVNFSNSTGYVPNIDYIQVAQL